MLPKCRSRLICETRCCNASLDLLNKTPSVVLLSLGSQEIG